MNGPFDKLSALLYELRAQQGSAIDELRRKQWRDVFGELERLRLHAEAQQSWVQHLLRRLVSAEDAVRIEQALAGDAQAQHEIERLLCERWEKDSAEDEHLAAAVEKAIVRLGGQAAPPLDAALRRAVDAYLARDEQLKGELTGLLQATAKTLEDLQPALSSEQASALAEVERLLALPLPDDPRKAKAMLAGVAGTLRKAAESVQSGLERIQKALAHQKQALAKLSVRLAQATQEAQRDPLTGLANRRAFARAAASCEQSDFALLLIDLDHFKQINDRYGHEVGDAALVHAARTFEEGLRRGDLLARIGGEEFVVLLPDADREAALRVAEKLRVRLANAPCKASSHVFRCTASIGVAVHRPGEPLGKTLRAADQAMYAAKRQGRNRVVPAD